MILSVLIEAALRSLALAAAVWLALRLFKVTNAESQSIAWRLVLIASLAMPLLMQFKIDLPLLPAPPASPASVLVQPAPAAFPTVPQAPVLQVVAPPAIQMMPAPQPSAARLSWRQALSATYALVVAAFLLRFLLGLGLTVRMAMRAQRIREDWTDGYHVRAGAHVPTPLTFGTAILLPLEYEDWSAEKRRAVIAHEGSHVRHGDFYAHVLSTLNRSIFWFSPLSWWLQKKLSQLAETISDDAALARIGDRTGYARMLLDISTQAQGTALGIAMANPSTIRSRVERVISETTLAPKMNARKKFLVALSLMPLLALTAVTGLKAAEPPRAAMNIAVQDVSALNLAMYQNANILFGQKIGKVEVSDPDLARITRQEGPDEGAFTPHTVSLFAWKVGHGTANFYDAKGALLYHLNLNVKDQPAGNTKAPPLLTLVAKGGSRAWLVVNMPDVFDVGAQGKPVAGPLDERRMSATDVFDCTKIRDAALDMLDRYSGKSGDRPAGADTFIADLRQGMFGVRDMILTRCLNQSAQQHLPAVDFGGNASPQRQGARPTSIRVASVTPAPIRVAQAAAPQSPPVPPPSASAQQSNLVAPIQISADKSNSDLRASTYTGNVVMKRGSLRLHADSLVVTRAGSQPSWISANGNVSIAGWRGNGVEQRGDHAEFDVATGGFLLSKPDGKFAFFPIGEADFVSKASIYASPQQQGALFAPIHFVRTTQSPTPASDAGPQIASAREYIECLPGAPRYHVNVNMQALASFGLNQDDLRIAVENNNLCGAPARSLDDIKQIVIGTKNGTPVHLSDVADVMLAPDTQQGALFAPIHFVRTTQSPTPASDAGPQVPSAREYIECVPGAPRYHVNVNMQALASFGLSSDSLRIAVENNNLCGMPAKSMNEIKQIVVGTKNGAPIHLSDVADVMLAPDTQQGAL